MVSSHSPSSLLLFLSARVLTVSSDLQVAQFKIKKFPPPLQSTYSRTTIQSFFFIARVNFAQVISLQRYEAVTNFSYSPQIPFSMLVITHGFN